jgi:tetratricopeptide repeat protein 8
MAKNEPVAIALCNYLLYVENNPKKALELAAECSNLNEYKNWWWKERIGKCYYLLGLYREAEKQF